MRSTYALLAFSGGVCFGVTYGAFYGLAWLLDHFSWAIQGG